MSLIRLQQISVATRWEPRPSRVAEVSLESSARVRGIMGRRVAIHAHESGRLLDSDSGVYELNGTDVTRWTTISSPKSATARLVLFSRLQPASPLQRVAQRRTAAHILRMGAEVRRQNRARRSHAGWPRRPIHHRPQQLSGGSQACGRARALVNKPSILLADERPVTSIQDRRGNYGTLEDLARQGKPSSS